MKSLMQLVTTMLLEVGMACRVRTPRDLETLSLRVKHEGTSFLTITLPQLGKAFERWLELGYVDSIPSAFSQRNGLPKFLSGFLSQVFNPDTLLLRDVPCVHCIRSIRQLTLMFKKILLPCKTSKERKAYAKYIATDQEVLSQHDKLYSRKGNQPIVEDSRRDDCLSFELKPELRDTRTSNVVGDDRNRRRLLFAAVSAALWGRRLQEIEVLIASGELIPRHGPGATAERISGNRKYALHR
jgi:hypothetical protein